MMKNEISIELLLGFYSSKLDIVELGLFRRDGTYACSRLVHGY